MKAREKVVFDAATENTLRNNSTIRALTEALRMINESKGACEGQNFGGRQAIADLREVVAEQEIQIRRLNVEIDGLNEKLRIAKEKAKRK